MIVYVFVSYSILILFSLWLFLHQSRDWLRRSPLKWPRMSWEECQTQPNSTQLIDCFSVMLLFTACHFRSSSTSGFCLLFL